VNCFFEKRWDRGRNPIEKSGNCRVAGCGSLGNHRPDEGRILAGPPLRRYTYRSSVSDSSHMDGLTLDTNRRDFWRGFRGIWVLFINEIKKQKNEIRGKFGVVGWYRCVDVLDQLIKGWPAGSGQPASFSIPRPAD